MQIIFGGLKEAKNHILSPYRWVLIGTGFFVVDGEIRFDYFKAMDSLSLQICIIFPSFIIYASPYSVSCSPSIRM